MILDLGYRWEFLLCQKIFTSCVVKKIGRNHTLPFTGGVVLRKEGKVLQIG